MTTTAPRLRSANLAVVAAVCVLVAAVGTAWILWQGVELPTPAGVGFISLGVIGWLAAVTAVWYGPLPDGQRASLVGAAMAVSTLSVLAMAGGAAIVLVELA